MALPLAACVALKPSERAAWLSGHHPPSTRCCAHSTGPGDASPAGQKIV